MIDRSKTVNVLALKLIKSENLKKRHIPIMQGIIDYNEEKLAYQLSPEQSTISSFVKYVLCRGSSLVEWNKILSRAIEILEKK